MSDKTKDIEEKLEYLNLDLNNVPEILLKNIETEINPARS